MYVSMVLPNLLKFENLLMLTNLPKKELHYECFLSNSAQNPVDFVI